MYEPKFKLNKKDEARWNGLLVRHCYELPGIPGGQVKLNPKYPPLTKEENFELEALDKKRSRKIRRHPKVAASIRCSNRQNLKTEKLLAKLKRLVRKIKKQHETAN